MGTTQSSIIRVALSISSSVWSLWETELPCAQLGHGLVRVNREHSFLEGSTIVTFIKDSGLHLALSLFLFWIPRSEECKHLCFLRNPMNKPTW